MMLPILISLSVAPRSYFFCGADCAGASAGRSNTAEENRSVLLRMFKLCCGTALDGPRQASARVYNHSLKAVPQECPRHNRIQYLFLAVHCRQKLGVTAG